MNVLSAGAARGLLHTVAAREGVDLAGEFGAVGAMRARLCEGAVCDMVLLTATMISELAAVGEVDPASVTAIGNVRTGVALPAAALPVNIDTVTALRTLFGGASRLYFPDPERATAGIHFMKVLTTLGLAEACRPRFATFANGAIAMRAMADANDIHAVGVTQCSEILYTDGVQLMGALPGEFGLATVYSAAISAKATTGGRRDAICLLAALASADNAATRIGAGFEPM